MQLQLFHAKDMTLAVIVCFFPAVAVKAGMPKAIVHFCQLIARAHRDMVLEIPQGNMLLVFLHF